jgi:hypothetical protein
MLKIYDEYKKHGVENYYKNYSSQYTNPHKDRIIKLYIKHIKPILTNKDLIIDIACGDGLICKLVNDYNHNYNIEGCDPYFTNKYCSSNLSFEDISQGKLTKKYDFAICCYAFHLLNDEWKYDFLTRLATSITKFIIITPSKKIVIKHLLWKITNELREDKITIIFLESIIN